MILLYIVGIILMAAFCGLTQDLDNVDETQQLIRLFVMFLLSLFWPLTLVWILLYNVIILMNKVGKWMRNGKKEDK